MKRTVVISMLAAAGVAFTAASASATVSLSITSPDPDNRYAPGEAVTLQVFGTANAGETANTVSGSILYSSALFVTAGAGAGQPTTSQNAIPNFSPGAIQCTTNRCQAFNQVVLSGLALAPNVTDFLLSTLTFTVAASATPQLFTFNWQSTPLVANLNWFGLDPLAQPGYTIQIVPEPTTVAMIGLGLFGLALASRDRVARRAALPRPGRKRVTENRPNGS